MSNIARFTVLIEVFVVFTLFSFSFFVVGIGSFIF